LADQCRKLGSYGWIIKTAAATPFRIGTAPIDLTAYTIEAYLHPPSGGAAKVITGANVVGSAVGEVTYTVGSGDFDEAGGWRVVLWADNTTTIRINSCDYVVQMAAG
jgi:hypothetical protein